MNGWLRVLALCVAVVAGAYHEAAAQSKSEFARTTIDIGVVVSDLDKSVAFYKDAIGFSEAPGFSVPDDFCADAGLTDNLALEIRVMVLGDGDDATKLKLMAVPGAANRKSDNSFIHSQLGYSYLTIYVADADQTAERLKAAGVKPVAQGPVPLPEGFPAGMVLSVVRDPDGNLIELIGPTQNP
jgi:catechol 2,3-dioxygenase-like lactoylglutathione lyase family enzyme